MNNTTHCPNCSTEIRGDFCSNCGQSQKGIDRFFLSLVNEAFEDVFSWNSRTWKTFVGLLFKPGFLSAEYFEGRRARYIQPIRLYFITSIVFFLLITMASYLTATNFKLTPEGVDATVEQTQELDSASTGVEPSTVNEVEKRQVLGDRVLVRQGQENEVLLDESTIRIPLLSDERNARLQERIGAQKEKLKTLAAEDLSGFLRELLEYAPPLLFCLVPLFALLLKIVYVYKRRYYTHHLVLAVHNHCFVFAILTAYTVVDLVVSDDAWIEPFISAAVFLWIPIYLWKSLRRVYGQGALLTSLNFVLLSAAYSVLLGSAAVIAFIIGMMTL